MHQKVHGLGIYILLTYAYPILSELAERKSDPFLPSFPHDQIFLVQVLRGDVLVS